MSNTKNQNEKEAPEALNDMLAAITDTLAKDYDLNILAFDRFKVRHISAYDGHNPQMAKH